MDVKFEIGDRLELTHEKSKLGYSLSENKYSSQILDFDGVRTAKIATPILEGRVVPLEVGDQYQMCFFTKKGLYQCLGRVEKRYVVDRIHIIEMLLLTEMKKFQRREFFRLDCMLGIEYREISEFEHKIRRILESDKMASEENKEHLKEALKRVEKEWKKGDLLDISGGGLRFHCENALEKKQIVEVRIPLLLDGGTEWCDFLVTVLGCSQMQGSYHNYDIRGRFVDIQREMQEKIVQFVFEEQRRRMKKE